MAARPQVGVDAVRDLYTSPFMELVHRAHTVHRAHHDPNEIQWSTLHSIKTGGCPEDCGYCSQSARFKTPTGRSPLGDPAEVARAAAIAKAGGATRFCMGAAWRRVSERDMPVVEEMVRQVKALGMETCVTLGTLSQPQAERLRDAGLDYYNHNLDTSREHYGNVVTTRSYDERLQTLANVRAAGLHVCCGGIVGLGETRDDRIALLAELANMPTPPESIPINQLVPIPGTPLYDKVGEVPWTEIVRTIATARILMPTSVVRLSAGRESMGEPLQAWCFMAGASSIFTGDKMLTTPTASFDSDRELLARLDLVAASATPPTADVKAPVGGACATGGPPAP